MTQHALERRGERRWARFSAISGLLLAILASGAATPALSPVASAQAVRTLCTSPSFAPAATYATGSQPAGLTVGDFNHDGLVDIAVANHGSNDVSLLLGNSDGTLRPAVNQNFLGLNGPAEIGAADLNQDGKLDLVVANSPNQTMWYALGNGDTTFQPYPQGYGTGYGATGAMVVGNISGISSPDVALTKPEAGEVDIFYGNGSGGQGTSFTFPAGPAPTGLALGHFNADGLTDLAITDSAANQVFVLLGGGPFGYTAGGTFATGSQPNGIATADFNGDGRADLVVANTGSNTLSLLLGNGDGTFQPAATFPVGEAPQRVAAGDFTGDGKVDVAVTNAGSNSVSILQGNGDGTFQMAMSVPVGAAPLGVVLADFNGDGKPDLAVTNHDGNSLSVVLNTCAADATPPTTVATPAGTLGEGGWYTGPVTVRLTAADNAGGSGVASTSYSVDGGPAEAYTAPFSITGDGSHAVTYQSTDGAGNQEPTQSMVIKIDSTPPTITGAAVSADGTPRSPNAAGWYTSPVAVHFTCSDSTSLVATCPVDQSVGEGKLQSVTGKASDNAGNRASATITGLSVDATPPVTTSVLDGAVGTNGWYVGPVTVTLSASDAVSGVTPGGTSYSIDGGATWEVYTTPVSFTNDGSYSLQVRSIDVAGNVETPKSVAFKIDQTPPTVKYSAETGTYTVDEALNITCTASDPTPGSGLGSSTCADVTGPAYKFPLGPNTATATATDTAGNLGTGSTKFTVNVTFGSLCTLTTRFVQGSTKFRALASAEQGRASLAANTLCQHLSSAQAAPTATYKAQFIAAYQGEVLALVQPGWLTQEQANILITLSKGL